MAARAVGEVPERPGAMRAVHRAAAALALLLLIASWAFAAWSWPSLPDRIPVHFDGAGSPDRFAGKDTMQWFWLPGLGVAIAAFALGVGWLLPMLAARKPDLINLPRKADFVALGEAARVRCLIPMQAVLSAFGATVLANLLYIQVGTYRVALGRWTTLPVGPFFALTGLGVIVVVVGILATRKAIAAEVAASQGAQR